MALRFDVGKSWLIFYTKDVYTQEILDELKELIGDPNRWNVGIFPSEFIDRIVLVGKEEQFELFKLLEKIKNGKT